MQPLIGQAPKFIDPETLETRNAARKALLEIMSGQGGQTTREKKRASSKHNKQELPEWQVDPASANGMSKVVRARTRGEARAALKRLLDAPLPHGLRLVRLGE